MADLIRGVLFDIDDTLFDYSSSERAGLLEHLAAEGLLDGFPSPEEAVARWRRIMEEEYDRFLVGELTFEEQRLVRVSRFLGRPVPEEEATAWFAGYSALVNAAWAAFPDAAPVLAALAPRYRLGVVTNSTLSHQLAKLTALGLLGHFGTTAIVCSSEYGQAKPHPGIFLEGCARLGLPPAQVAFVGDKYDIDALGARDAGLRAFWLDRSGRGAVPARESAAGSQVGAAPARESAVGPQVGAAPARESAAGRPAGDVSAGEGAAGSRAGDGREREGAVGSRGGDGPAPDGVTVIGSLEELLTALDAVSSRRSAGGTAG
ncbi:HAD-IA family hydrolase [Nonomuraea sp. NPDC003754]